MNVEESLEAVYYSSAGAEVMRRAQGEFHKALREVEQKTELPGSARVIKLAGGNR
jgi:hypothetical protein